MWSGTATEASGKTPPTISRVVRGSSLRPPRSRMKAWHWRETSSHHPHSTSRSRSVARSRPRAPEASRRPASSSYSGASPASAPRIHRRRGRSCWP